MRRLMSVLVAIVLMAGISGLSFAQGPANPKDAMAAKPMEMKKDMKKCMMCPMHCGMMMKKMMIATSDGGVIVMAGKKLIKYDKDLNLVKEVEIKMDMEKMMKDCPMCHEMMEHHDMKGKGMEKKEETE